MTLSILLLASIAVYALAYRSDRRDRLGRQRDAAVVRWWP